MAEIALNRLTKTFPNGVTALSEVSLTVADGEMVVFLGPSGCGKTTLLRLAAGLESATSGTIQIGGEPVDQISPAERNLAFVFQRPALYPQLTVKRNIEFSLELQQSAISHLLSYFHPKWRSKNSSKREDNALKVSKTVKLLELDGLLSRLPRELSGGQQQRVALGRAMVRKPQAYLLDEPLSGLDLPQRVELRQQLHLLQRQLHATMLYVTHDQTEALALADRIVVLDRGVVQQAGSPAEVFEQPANRFVASFIGSPAMSFLSGEIRSDGPCLYLGGEGAEILLPDGKNGLAKTCLPDRITLGIRPEDVLLDEVGTCEGRSSGPPELVMNVDSIEYVGSCFLVKLRCGAWELNSQQLGPVQWAAGDAVEVSLNRCRLHWFDFETGERLSPI